MSFANFIDDAAGHGTNRTYGEPLDSNSTASSSSENAQKETNHPPPPDRLSVGAAVVFSRVVPRMSNPKMSNPIMSNTFALLPRMSNTLIS